MNYHPCHGTIFCLLLRSCAVREVFSLSSSSSLYDIFLISSFCSKFVFVELNLPFFFCCSARAGFLCFDCRLFCFTFFLPRLFISFSFCIHILFIFCSEVVFIFYVLRVTGFKESATLSSRSQPAPENRTGRSFEALPTYRQCSARSLKVPNSGCITDSKIVLSAL